MPSSTIVIAPWGCPAQWKQATYVINDEQEVSCTSLVPLLKKLSKDSGEVSVVLVVLDSLVDKYRGKPTSSSCYKYYMEYYAEIFENTEIAGYDDLVDRCKRLAENIAKSVAEEKGVRIGDLRVLVGPCVGSPGGGWRFEGDARDFIALVLYELGKLCLERRYERIVLDLTHGVNFMPSTCLVIAYLLSSLLLVAHGLERVKLEVYNSDPYPPGASLPELNLNLILKENVKNVYVPHEVPRTIVKPRAKLDEKLRREVDKLNNSFSRTVRSVISALYYPLPLALCKAIKEHLVHQEALRILGEAIKLWKQQVHVDQPKQYVQRRLRLIPEAVYVALLSHAAATRARSVVEDEEHVKLEDLEELSGMYEAINESYYYIINDEVNRVKRNLSKYFQQNPTVQQVDLATALREQRALKPNKRVMIAHAGLQKELVIAKRDGTLDYDYRALNATSIDNILEKAGLLLPTIDK